MTSPFSSIKINSLTAKNRIIRSATNDHLGNTDATVSDAQIEMYDRLARNEVGTIITGHLSVDPEISNRADIAQLSIGDDDKISGLRRIADKIHEYGALAVAQISHAGPRGLNPIDFNQLTTEEMTRIGEWFVSAAVRAQKAGFDAIQIHAAHWYLFASVLNADLNRRTDRYGVDAAGRISIVTDIVKAVRRECGKDFGIFVKINAHNTLPGVDDEDMLIEYARALFDAGIDHLEVSGMSFAKQPREAQCYFIEAAAAVKKAIPSLTVSLVGGIYSRETIERALSVVDMASMARTLLTQPDFLVKMRDEDLQKSRCIRCNKCFEIFKTKYERCIFGPVNSKLEETFAPKN
ncbi:MAG: NADH:flavin oxidoreductase [Muribaculaceae bacterium]|nr:NADH:flavin oxidoreductase [Muribaculaceae bacterium]